MNGTEQLFNSGMTLHDLLRQLEVPETLCAIEVNETLVPHQHRESFKISDGDSIEIVTLVGGG